MFLIAVTGGIACGKTKVCEVFQKHYPEIPVVNADVISRESKWNWAKLKVIKGLVEVSVGGIGWNLEVR